MASASRSAARQIGRRYEVIETIGRGGQGTVVKALDIRHDRFVALKIRRVPDDPREVERLLSEVRTMLDLSPHPGLPTARDDFFDDDQHVLVLDWVDGIDLGRVLATDGVPGLPPSTVLRWAAQAAAALTHLHTHDPWVVHGDVTPSNLVLDRNGRIVCVDLGVSSVPGRVQRGGTPGYRAPELAAGGPSTPAADVYGLAATVFALLTGEPPSGQLPPWSGLDPDRARRLEAALRLGLATDPRRRPATVGELVELMRAGEPESLPTGTVTVLATDVVDSVALWEAHPLDMPAALARHALLVDQAVEQHGGRRLGDDTDGAATLSVFSRAADAVAAAVALNGNLVGASTPVLQIRAGAHTGHVGRDGQGPTVNRAVSMRALAGAGQVLLTGATARLVAAERLDGIAVVALGRHHLEGIADGEDVAAVSAAGLDVPPDPALPPYPGLLPFSPDDADIYVGRDDEVSALRAMLAPGRTVAVLGASGSGKSSLLRAGLLPHLPGAVLCTPGADPLASLAKLELGNEEVLIVDQLEELVTLCDDPARQGAFVERLGAHEGGVVVGLRTDAFAGLSQFPTLADAITQHHVLLAPLRTEQMRAVIEVPAERRGLRLEAGLVELVIADAHGEPGALPLVAHAMRETWLRRDGRTMTVAAYQETGGVQGAIGASAEGVFAGLDAADRELMRVVLLRMVRPGDGAADSRRRVELDELRDLGAGESTDRVVERLAAARLVTVDRESVQLAHEALLRAWPRLVEWIDEQRDDLRRHRHLTTAAQAWSTAGRDAAELYRGARLDGALELVRRVALTGTEQQFIDASVANRDDDAQKAASTNRRLRRLLVGVGILFVVALVGALVAVLQARRAADERDRADAATIEAEGARLAAEARASAATEPDLALLLAVEASRRADTVETRSALLGALTAHPQLVAKLHGVESGLESIEWSPDGTRLAAPTSDSTGTLVWDTAAFDVIGTPLATGEPFHLDFDATFTPDGGSLLVAGVTEQRSNAGPTSVSAGLQVWDVASGAARSTIALAVIPEAVAAVDATHALVIGQPVAGEGDAIQIADLVSGRATSPEVVADEPIAVDVTGGAVVVLSADGVLQIIELDDTSQPDSLRSTSFRLDTVIDGAGGPDVVAYRPGPDGGLVAVGSESGAVALVALSAAVGDTGTAELLGELDVAEDLPSTIAFSADGALVAVGGLLGTTQLFDTESRLPAGPPLAGLAGSVNDVAFSPDGSHLAVAGLDRTGSIWSLDGTRSIGQPIAGQTNAVVATMPLPNGETVLTASYDGSLAARSITTAAVSWSIDTGEPIWSAALDPTGTRVALGGDGGRLAVVSAADGKLISGPVQLEHPVETVAWSPAADLLAVGADRDDDQPAYALAFLDPATLQPAGAPVLTTGGSAMGLAFSPDGTRLAVVLDNNLIRIVDVAGRTLEARYLESVDVPYFSVAWSPDGGRLATGTTGGTVQLWDTTTLKRAAPPGQQNVYPIRGLAFNSDGTLLASTTEMATSQLWDVHTGSPIGGALVGGEHPISIFAIPEPERDEIPFIPSFSANGLHLFVGSDEPMIWSLDPDAWRKAAVAIAGRQLTDIERTTFGA